MQLTLGDFSFDAGLRGSARGVSFVRVLLAALVISNLGYVFDPRLYTMDISAAVIAFVAYGAALMMLAGFHSRKMTALLAVFLFGIFLSSQLKIYEIDNLMNIKGSFGAPTHLYFMAIFALLLSLTPCGNFYSVDSFLKQTNESGNLALVGVQLIRLQVVSTYYWTAISKINSKFLSGYSFETAWIFINRGALSYFHDPQTTEIFALIAKCVIPLELLLGTLLLVPRFRLFGIVLGTLFHIGATVFLPVWFFSATVIISYILFLKPEQFDRAVRRVFAR